MVVETMARNGQRDITYAATQRNRPSVDSLERPSCAVKINRKVGLWITVTWDEAKLRTGVNHEGNWNTAESSWKASCNHGKERVVGKNMNGVGVTNENSFSGVLWGSNSMWAQRIPWSEDSVVPKEWVESNIWATVASASSVQISSILRSSWLVMLVDAVLSLSRYSRHHLVRLANCFCKSTEDPRSSLMEIETWVSRTWFCRVSLLAISWIVKVKW